MMNQEERHTRKKADDDICAWIGTVQSRFVALSAYNSGRIFRLRGYLGGYLYGFQSDFWEDMGG